MKRRFASGTAALVLLAGAAWGGWTFHQKARPAESGDGATDVAASAVAASVPLVSAAPPIPGSPLPATSPVVLGRVKLDLFFTGRRVSSIEPCGCHSQQNGGVQFEASLYGLHSDGSQVRVDAGAWTSANVENSPLESMKTRYVLRAMTLLQMDAVNVGPTDISQTLEYFNQIKVQWPQAIEPLVSANIFLKDKPDQLAFPPYRIVRKALSDGSTATIGVVGAASLRKRFVKTPSDPDPTELISGDFIARRAEECLPGVLEELRPRVELLVLLYSGDLTSAVGLADKFQQVDYLVCAGTPVDPTTVYYREGQVNVLLNQNVMGRELGLAPLARDEHGKWSLARSPVSLPVERELKVNPQLQALIDEFKKETQTLDDVLPEAGVERIYAGAVRCNACHQEFHQDWAKTRHARALQSLIDRGQQFNPECLPCHVVGFRQANGFYSVNHPLSQPMYHVQCENCHGPSGKHVELQRKIQSGARWMKPEDYAKLQEEAKQVVPSVDVPEAICLKCHTPENDHHFVYAEKIGKVNHREVLSRPPTPGAAAPVEQPGE